MKRTRISVLLVIALLLQLYAPLTAGAADFTPNPQTEWGCGQNLGPYGYPADKFGVRIPLDCLYSRGLIPPRESLIRFSQYQCRY